MSVLPIGISGEAGAYQIERSLRFNSADSAYLNRTLTTPTNNKIFTYSVWVKRSGLGSSQTLLDAYVPATSFDTIRFNSSDQLDYFDNTAGYLTTTQVFRDVGSWYHIVAAVDTTQATSSNRVKLYVNGTQVTAFSATAYPSLNQAIIFNSAVVHDIGRFGYSANAYLSGYLADVYFIDGQALTPSSFGETDTDTGVWKPKAYSGSYGTNGFYLDFGDNSSTTALGYDAAGSNDWTPNNFSVTAGAGNDSLVDSPTRYGTDTGVGGEVRGNYATLNPLDKGSSGTMADGNLSWTYGSASWQVARATMSLPSTGKWYWEVPITSLTSYVEAGVATQAASLSSYIGNDANGWSWQSNAVKLYNGTGTSFGTSASVNDVLMVAVNRDTSKIWVGRNGTWFASGDPAAGTNEMFSGLTTGDLFAAVACYQGTVYTNFGQRAFSYSAPSGFKALCTTNLPEPTLKDGADYMNVKRWTGNGSTQSITGIGFQPDLVWTKDRGAAFDHTLFDAVRGATKFLRSNVTNEEETRTDSLTSFDSDGFSVGADSVRNNINKTDASYVSWVWKANGSGTSVSTGSIDGTNPTIASTVSANTTSGFSIVTYSGTGTAGTIAHGCKVGGVETAPSLIIVKRRNGGTGYSWHVQHVSTGNTKALFLDDVSGGGTSNVYWNSTSPTSKVFTAGTDTSINGSDGTFVAYCFAPAAGFSAFGSYSGVDTGKLFVYTGFRPAFVMLKKSSSASVTYGWPIMDNSRPFNTTTYEGYNPTLELWADAETGELSSTSNYNIDLVSNGFCINDPANSNVNSSGNTYIYAAFAENPFKYALAR